MFCHSRDSTMCCAWLTRAQRPCTAVWNMTHMKHGWQTEKGKVTLQWTYCEGTPCLAPAPSASLWALLWASPTLSPSASPSLALSSPLGHKTHSRCLGSPCGKWSGEQNRVREQRTRGEQEPITRTLKQLEGPPYRNTHLLSFPWRSEIRMSYRTDPTTMAGKLVSWSRMRACHCVRLLLWSSAANLTRLNIVKVI